MQLPVDELNASVVELDLGEAKVYHLPEWDTMSHPERLRVIRQIAEMRGRDPRISRLSVDIIRKSGAKPRQYEKQAAAILRWVQDPANCYYVNEPGERLQDPIYTIKAGHGDCDDSAALICSMFESIRLPWRLVLSGTDANGAKVRYIEGNAVPPNVKWAHIYAMVGVPPYRPTMWWYCEPTVVGVPLGWDVVSGDASFLPELGNYSGPTRIMPAPIISAWQRLWRPAAPPPERRSPAYGLVDQPEYGQASLVGSVVGAAVAEADDNNFNWNKTLQTMAIGIVTGVTISVITSVVTPMVKKHFGVK